MSPCMVQSSPAVCSLLSEATRSLARLDADRLEELALSCAALIRDWEQSEGDDRQRLALDLAEARPQMDSFARVLEVTRSNLEVTARLRRAALVRAGSECALWAGGRSPHGYD